MDGESSLKPGVLVRAYRLPVCNKKIDLDCLGVVQKTFSDCVEVSWPGEGVVIFNYMDLESVDSNVGENENGKMASEITANRT